MIEYKIAHDQVIHPGPHKSAIRVLRAAHDRFPPDIEGSVDQHSASCDLFKIVDQLPELRVLIRTYGLNTGRIIDMGDGRNAGTNMIKPVVQAEIRITGR